MEEASKLPATQVYAAGVAVGTGGCLVTAGGRVLGVTGRGGSIDEARSRAYQGAQAISWPGVTRRGDIAASVVGARQ
jgi:phosphoribosylamine--glycine ligase